jgi:hypothetical protein
MGKADRLGLLQVGIAGHNHVDVLFGPLQNSLLQFEQIVSQQFDLALQPQPGIGSYLIVAGAAGMELAGHVAH